MADSVSEAVGDKVQAAIAALNLLKPNVTPNTLVPIARRKSPSAPEGTSNGVPEIVISVGTEPPSEYVDAQTKLRKYPVGVTIVTAGGTKAADDLVVRKWRDQIDGAIDTRTAFAGLLGWNDVEAGGGAPFDERALSRDFNYSVQVFTVSVLEARS